LKALAVLVVVAVAGPGCPLFAPECKGDAVTTLAVDGEKCDGCTVDFGDVEVPLQEHRRLDITQGCQDDFLDTPSITGAAFTLSNFQFPPAPGGQGFAEVSFTASDPGEETGSLDLPTADGDLVVDLHGNGVNP
jgi:hypothetical protein